MSTNRFLQLMRDALPGVCRTPSCGQRSRSLAQRLIAGLLLIAIEITTMQAGVHHVLTLGLGRAAHAAPVADAGTSLNRYRQFNVDASGLVIINDVATGIIAPSAGRDPLGNEARSPEEME